MTANAATFSNLDRFTAGSRTSVHIELPPLPNGAPILLPVAVLKGAEPGPTVFISAAVHGDEINGVDIVRRLLRTIDPKEMAGCLLALPIVDVYGFNLGSRYLPDRRDLNRSFPGSATGSLASRVAHIFVTEIVDYCAAGIDLHTAAEGRANLPQVRGVFDNARFVELAAAFGAPVTMNSKIIGGSLREVADERDIPYLLYEGGAAGRFEPEAIEIGTAGCLRVLKHLGVINDAPKPLHQPTLVAKARWLRAPRSGVLDTDVALGDRVRKGDVLATITDTFGDGAQHLEATASGIVVGIAIDPLVQAGDALFNIGKISS